MQLDGRTISMDSYRYGFQNQEKDDELKGAGNSVNYKYRMHDPRVGRFFAVDPLASKYPWNSTYAFSENKLIAWRELEGLESYYAADGFTFLGQIGNSSEPRVLNSVEAERHVKNAIYKEKMGLTTSHQEAYEYDLDMAKKCSKGYYESIRPIENLNLLPYQTKRSENDLVAYIDNTNTVVGTVDNFIPESSKPKLPNSVSGGLTGGNVVINIINLYEHYENLKEGSRELIVNDNSGKLEKAGKDVGISIVDGIVGTLAKKHPVSATIYFGARFIYEMEKTPKAATGLPENWSELNDKDNTRTDKTGGGY